MSRTKLPLETAMQIAARRASPLQEEYVELPNCLGRLLTTDIFAKFPQPPFDRSPLDGYAVIAEDTAGASDSAPVVLKVVDKVFAGENGTVPIRRGETVRVMTGSMLPEGADSVIRQEDTDGGDTTVQIYRSVRAGMNYCVCGEEYQAADRLLCAGQTLDAAAIAVAAGAGYDRLPVRRKVRVAVVVTGDEVVQPGEPLEPGKIYDVNMAYLNARLTQLGVAVTKSLYVKDETKEITAALKRCLEESDLVLTTGGVSVGQKDLVETSLSGMGAEILFHGIDMKPGMPTLLSVYKGRLVLGLSGNPFSAAAAFELLIHPILEKMEKNTEYSLEHISAQAANSFPKRSPSRRFLRGKVVDGQVTIPGLQSNGQMRSMIGCNCLVDVPAGTDHVNTGDPVKIILL